MAKQETSVAVAEKPVAHAKPVKYRITLTAPTHIEFPELTIDAASESEAWQKFMDANGISGSECPRTIEQVR